jgi:hypothetical protein
MNRRRFVGGMAAAGLGSAGNEPDSFRNRYRPATHTASDSMVGMRCAETVVARMSRAIASFMGMVSGAA